MVGHPVDLEGGELRPAGRDPASYVAHGQAGPPGEVGGDGRSVALKVAQRELAERLLTIQVPWPRNPVVEERERLLPAVGRSEDERAGLGEVPEEVVAALAVRADAGRVEGGEERVARQGPAAGQG
jgi:hypothetical protein